MEDWGRGKVGAGGNPTCPRAKGAQASPQSHGSRLPEDWTLPEEWRAWAETHGLNGRVSVEAERFRDYWVGAPGQKGRKADWQATWRNWCRRAAETQPKPKRHAYGLDALDELFGPDAGTTYDGEVVR